MTKELQEQLKTVAEYDGKRISEFDDTFFVIVDEEGVFDYDDIIFYSPDTNWSQQIPIWSKVLKEVNMLFSKRFPTRIAIIMHDYHKATDNNSPTDGFKVLVELIQFINKHKEK